METTKFLKKLNNFFDCYNQNHTTEIYYDNTDIYKTQLNLLNHYSHVYKSTLEDLENLKKEVLVEK